MPPTTDVASPPAQRTDATAAVRGASRLAPGVALAVAIAAAATVVGGHVPVVGAPVIAIVAGITIAAVRRPGARLRPGITFTGRRVLQTSIVILGTGLSFGQVLSTGGRSLPVLVGTLVAALAMAWVVGRALGLARDLRTLVGVGTAICGASAIAATDAVIGADEADVSYAIATIFTFNVAAVLLFPMIGHALGLSPHTFGLWAGTAVNDLSSVVAAATVYGHGATSYAVIVKLTRTLAIVPIALALAARRGAPGDPSAGRRGTGPRGQGARRAHLRRIVPLFILGFVAAVAVNTAGLVPVTWHHPLANLATFMITAALAAIGLSTDVHHIRRAGVRPLALGAVLWVTVGLTSLGLQAATGTLH